MPARTGTTATTRIPTAGGRVAVASAHGAAACITFSRKERAMNVQHMDDERRQRMTEQCQDDLRTILAMHEARGTLPTAQEIDDDAKGGVRAAGIAIIAGIFVGLAGVALAIGNRL